MYPEIAHKKMSHIQDQIGHNPGTHKEVHTEELEMRTEIPDEIVVNQGKRPPEANLRVPSEVLTTTEDEAEGKAENIPNLTEVEVRISQSISNRTSPLDVRRVMTQTLSDPHIITLIGRVIIYPPEHRGLHVV